MPYLPVHPAPGLGDLMNGWFNVPGNPITTPGTPLVPSVTGLMGGAPSRRKTLGELMAASFVLPQNPLCTALSGGMGNLGCGCGGCQGTQQTWSLNGLSGLGAMTDFTSWMSAASPVSSSIPNWMFFGGIAAIAGYFMFHGHHRSGGGRRAAAPATA